MADAVAKRRAEKDHGRHGHGLMFCRFAWYRIYRDIQFTHTHIGEDKTIKTGMYAVKCWYSYVPIFDRVKIYCTCYINIYTIPPTNIKPEFFFERQVKWSPQFGSC